MTQQEKNKKEVTVTLPVFIISTVIATLSSFVGSQLSNNVEIAVIKARLDMIEEDVDEIKSEIRRPIKNNNFPPVETNNYKYGLHTSLNPDLKRKTFYLKDKKN